MKPIPTLYARFLLWLNCWREGTVSRIPSWETLRNHFLKQTLMEGRLNVNFSMYSIKSFDFENWSCYFTPTSKPIFLNWNGDPPRHQQQTLQRHELLAQQRAFEEPGMRLEFWNLSWGMDAMHAPGMLERGQLTEAVINSFSTQFSQCNCLVTSPRALVYSQRFNEFWTWLVTTAQHHEVHHITPAVWKAGVPRKRHNATRNWHLEFGTSRRKYW